MKLWLDIGSLAILAISVSLIGFAYGQDAKDRQNAALPTLVEQRNNALDSVALCQGDLAIMKQKLAEATAELEKLKAEKK